MQVEPKGDGLIVIPETEFETKYLRRFSDEKRATAFLKHGASVCDVVGVVVANRTVPTAKVVDK